MSYLSFNTSQSHGSRNIVINFTFFKKPGSIKSRPIRRNSLSALRREFPFVPKAQLATTSVVNLAHSSLVSNSPVERAEKRHYNAARLCGKTAEWWVSAFFFAILRAAVPAVVCFVSRYLCWMYSAGSMLMLLITFWAKTQINYETQAKH